MADANQRCPDKKSRDREQLLKEAEACDRAVEQLRGVQFMGTPAGDKYRERAGLLRQAALRLSD